MKTKGPGSSLSGLFIYNDPIDVNACFAQFDSSILGARWPRRLGAARMILRCDFPHEQALLIESGSTKRRWDDPLDALQWLGTDARRHDWIGWISYDLGRWFERIPAQAQDDLRLPLFVFTAHGPQSSPSPGTPGEDRGQGSFEKDEGRRMKVPRSRSIGDEGNASRVTGVSPVRVSRRAGSETPVTPSDSSLRLLTSSFTRETYESSVQRVIDYISAGDVFQVNLAQRFTAPLLKTPREVYGQLCHEFPAAYGALLEYDDFALICNSPELFLRVTPDRKVITRPIKGTRPRLPGMESELRQSAKDQAELNMIIDLERNDLGRVCEVGSVKVIQPRVIETHPTVYHGVATIEGKLRDDVSFVDLLRATFPGGSVTGAPKIRAMEIIDQIEPLRRGPYCGAIGHLDSDGTIEFNLAIRTMIARDGLIHIPVGGGIVADSNPKAEYEETLVKAKAMFAAIGIAEI